MKEECDRSFWDESAGGDVSAIALFGMQVLMGMRVRSLFCDVSAGGGESAIALFRM